MTVTTPTFGSLFSGIGGLDLGLERAGWTCKWQVEIDEFCQRVLAKHWPEVPRYRDVKELDPNDLELVDLVCGGFPCQPVSVAGRRAAQADDRWLWPDFARILRVVRPRWALLENVPGLLTAGFGDVLSDLATLGYDVEWDCLPAVAFGAPHLRYRVFVVAHAQRVGVRNEPVALARSNGATLPLDNGPSQPVANTPGDLRRRRSDEGSPLRAAEVEPDEGEPISEPADGGRSAWWDAEPDVGRVADGVPLGVDRRRALGNAVVPHVAEWIGRRLMEVA